MKNGEKSYIPGTNPEWNRELPDRDLNSLVDKFGNNWDNGYNFDEKEDGENTSYDTLGREIPFNPEGAKKPEKKDCKSCNKMIPKRNLN